MGIFGDGACVDCIVSATGIAELVATGAGDMIASLVFLHYHIASSASLEEVIFFEVFDHFVVLASICDDAGSGMGGQVAVGTMGNLAGVALKKAFHAVYDSEAV